LLGAQFEAGFGLREGLLVAGSYDLAFGLNQEGGVADIGAYTRNAARQRLADSISKIFTVEPGAGDVETDRLPSAPPRPKLVIR